MKGQKDKHGEIESKLQRGLQTLSEASVQDKNKLGMALITIHSALEDFIRFEVARKAPDLRERVEDVQQTRWNDLLDYGRVYLGFSDSDCRRINDANSLRLRVAHGGDYTIRHAYLVEYASLVERLCIPGQPLPVTAPRKHETTVPARNLEVRQPSYTDQDRKPRNRAQGGLPRLIAYSIIIGIILAGIGFLAYFGLFTNSFPDWLHLLNSSFLSTAVPQSNNPPALNEAAPATDLPLQPASGNDATCTIVWEEYTAGDLAGKNRSMVWEEIVKFQVNGSAMTHLEFYDLVAEQNPDLKMDGYEFKKGKTYLLPLCQ